MSGGNILKFLYQCNFIKVITCSQSNNSAYGILLSNNFGKGMIFNIKPKFKMRLLNYLN